MSTVRGQTKKNKKQIIEHHNEMLELELYVHDHLQPIISKQIFEFSKPKSQNKPFHDIVILLMHQLVPLMSHLMQFLYEESSHSG